MMILCGCWLALDFFLSLLFCKFTCLSREYTYFGKGTWIYWYLHYLWFLYLPSELRFVHVYWATNFHLQVLYINMESRNLIACEIKCVTLGFLLWSTDLAASILRCGRWRSCWRGPSPPCSLSSPWARPIHHLSNARTENQVVQKSTCDFEGLMVSNRGYDEVHITRGCKKIDI